MTNEREYLLEGGSYRCGWFDHEHTIMLVEILHAWTWDDADVVLPAVRQAIVAEKHGVYTVFHFTKLVTLLPQGKNPVLQLKRHMEIDIKNCLLVVFVGIPQIVQTLLSLLKDTYGLQDIYTKYRFVISMEKALHLIDLHKAELNPN